jgi:hypothetical protein
VQDVTGVQNATDLENVTNKGDEECGVGARKEVAGGVIDVSTIVDTVMIDSGNDEKDDGNDNFQPEPSRKSVRKSYDSRRKFQLSWVARCPWAEAMEVEGVTMVKCTTCLVVTGKPTILALKITILQQHQGNYTAEKNMLGDIKKGDKYVNADYQHLKNERTIASRGVHPIDEAIQDMVGKKAQKRQQMGIIFHLL